MPRIRYLKYPRMSGEELRAIRLRLRMTQEQFGRALAKHRITISDYEREKFPIPETVARLARSLR